MEDDESLSNIDKSPVLLDNNISNQDDNVRSITNTEQFAPDSHLATDLEPAADIEEPVGFAELVAELESAAAIETDVVPVVELQNLQAPDSQTVATDQKCDFDDETAAKDRELIGHFDDAEAGGKSECSTAMNDVDVINEKDEIRESIDGDKCELIGDIDDAKAVEKSECSMAVNEVGSINEEIRVVLDSDKCEDVPKLEELEPIMESRIIVNEDEHMCSQVLQREDVHVVDGLEPLIEVGIDAKEAEFEDNEVLLRDDVPKLNALEPLIESRIDAKEGEVADSEVVKEEEIIEGAAELEHLRPVGEDALDVKEEDVKEEETFTMMSEVSVSGLVTEVEEVKGQMEVVETELCVDNEDEDGDMVTVEHEIPTSKEIMDANEDVVAGKHENPIEKEGEDDDKSVEENEMSTLQEKDDGGMLAEEHEIPTLQEKDDEDDDMLVEQHENPIPNEDKNENEDLVDEDHENTIKREAENEGIAAEVPTEKDDEEMGDEEHEVHTEKEDEDGDEQETPTTEMETEVGRGSGKQRRGRNSNVTTRASARKTVEEDVCFICFDGGDLVLCDRRGCPKAYHPTCVNRDEEFFQAKGRWNCGWHLCSICEKNANYMCYTCTFSLCKGCTKDAVIKCVRGNKGFCETCMKTVMLIESNELGKDETAQVNFNDKSSWEYLFKDYWSDLKGKLTLSLDEVAQAKNPWKGSDIRKDKQGSPVELYDPNHENGSGSDNPSGNKGSTPRKRKVPKKRVKPIVKEEDSASASDNSENPDTRKSKKRKGKKLLKSRAKRGSSSAEGSSGSSRNEWASKELLEFVMHMKDGDSSVLSQFDVQALLLDYIKMNKLRDPRRKSQIICDMRLQNLFGKQRVGHFEMLKLLESHFLIREDSQADDLQGIVVDTETSNLDTEDALTKGGKSKKRKARRKGDRRALQDNVDDYAAIDTHNINLVYLKRNVMEALLDDLDYFYDKIIGSFVRIRISGSSQKQEMYRLVQVVGTSKADEPYKVVKRTTDIVLEIQNLNKKEVISMDIISNQDFTEDECKRLRQSIKCGLINRLTLGDIQEKAMALQEARVNDWLEAEVLRLSHLSDRASDTGRRKELRECVEKIQVLKTPEERQRRLEEIPEIHTDPKMDPSYESEEEEGEPDDAKQDNLGSRSTSFSRRGSQPFSPRTGTPVSNDSWSGTRISPGTRDLSRNVSSRGFSNRREDVTVTGNLENENTWTQERYKGSVSEALPETSPPSLSVGNAQDIVKVNETEKTWLYRDPSGKVQGPFSITQLRKWNNTGYFPKDLKIWRSTESQDDDSIMLTNALNGNFQKELAPHLLSSHTGKLNGTTLISSSATQGGEISKGSSALTGEASKFSTNGWNSNLPSPTPNRTSENNLSPTPPSAGFAQQIKTEHNGIERSGVISSSISDSLRQLIQQGSDQGLSNLLLPNVSSTIQPEQGISSQNDVRYQAGGQVNQSADTGNLVQSGTSYNNTEVSQGWSSGSVVATQNVDQSNLGINPVQQQPGYSQWGPPAPVNQAIVQPNTGWGPMPGNPNMSWGAMPPQGNVNLNWGATVQGPAPQVWPTSAPEIMNPNWATSAQGQLSGNPNPNWVASAPAPGNTNPGWGPSGPGQPPPNWAVPGNGNPWVAPVPGNTYPGWVPSNQGPPLVNPSPNWAAPPNTNSGWIAPNQVPAAPANPNSGWVTPNQVPAPANPNANASWGTPNQAAPAPANANSGWGTPNQAPAPANANAGWNSNSGLTPGIRGNDQNRNGDRYPRDSRNNSQGGNGRGWNRGGGGGDSSSSSRPRVGRGVCDFYLNGHCKKGSNCDRTHPP